MFAFNDFQDNQLHFPSHLVHYKSSRNLRHGRKLIGAKIFASRVEGLNWFDKKKERDLLWDHLTERKRFKMTFRSYQIIISNIPEVSSNCAWIFHLFGFDLSGPAFVLTIRARWPKFHLFFEKLIKTIFSQDVLFPIVKLDCSSFCFVIAYCPTSGKVINNPSCLKQTHKRV